MRAIKESDNLNVITGIELDEVLDLSSGDVYLDGIIGLAERVWVADGPTVVGCDVWDPLRSNTHFTYTAQLVLQVI